MQLRRICLGITHTPDGQTSRLTAEALQELLKEFGAVSAAWIGVTDTAANMKALALNEMKHCWFPCIAHTLNLVIEDAVKALVAVNDSLDLLSSIIRFFHQSSIAAARLNIEIDQNADEILRREVVLDPRRRKRKPTPRKLSPAHQPVGIALLTCLGASMFSFLLCRCFLNEQILSSSLSLCTYSSIVALIWREMGVYPAKEALSSLNCPNAALPAAFL